MENCMPYIDGIEKNLSISFKQIIELESKTTELTAQLATARDALEKIARQTVIMGSRGEYRNGQIHGIEACQDHALAALKATQPKEIK